MITDAQRNLLLKCHPNLTVIGNKSQDFEDAENLVGLGYLALVCAHTEQMPLGASLEKVVYAITRAGYKAARLLSPDLAEVLNFLNSIEGDGYGGMASFEIARSTIRDLVAPTPVSSEYETVLNSWAEFRELLSESRQSEEKIKSVAKRAFEFLQDKTFRPESDNKLCDEIVNDLAGAFAKGDGRLLE